METAGGTRFLVSGTGFSGLVEEERLAGRRLGMAGGTLGLDGLLKGPLTRDVIVGLRTRALRRRVWFRVLDRVERGLVDLTIRWVDRVRSGRLARVLLGILAKLVRVLESRMVRVLERGRVMALQMSELAISWGNELAWLWRSDRGFQRALGVGVLLAR